MLRLPLIRTARRFLGGACLAAMLAGCMSYPPPPPAPYRAVGQEPGWTLLIDSRDVTFIPQDGQMIRQPAPKPIIGIAGEIYQTPRIGVNIVHVGCTDSMSGQAYRDRVEVDVDGRRYVGCGGDTVAPAGVAGTSWRVAAINGRSTPSAGDYSLSFEQDRMGARFGCNSIGGRYQQQGAVIRASDVVGTQMACSEPADSFERQGLAVLMQPMTATWTGGDRLTLANAAGRIELKRSF